jgi:hypothetical protein
MTFRKNGDNIPVHRVLCKCGHELRGAFDKCPNCGKTVLPEGLQPVQEPPAEKDPVEDNQKLNK